MMPFRRGILVSLVVVALAAGCGTSKPSRFYTIDPVAISDGTPPSHAAVIVGPVSVPATVDQPQMVVRVSANRVELEEFDRWAAPLNDIIARAVASDLTVLLGTTEVSTAPLDNAARVYRVTINVQRFESVRGQSVLVDAVWAVRDTAGGTQRFGRTSAQEQVQGDSFEALAAAHSRAIARMSNDIASAIRMEDSARM